MENSLQIGNAVSLLKRLKQGDEEAFTTIYNTYWQPLFFIAHKRLQCLEDAKEIVQEVFLTLWHKKENLNIDSLPHYLAAMVRYAVYKQLANNQRLAEGVRALQENGNKVAPPFDIDNKQFIEMLHTLADDLPEKCRIVFVNHRLLGQPLNEVAEQLGISPRTAEDYVTKAMKVMRKNREQFSILLLFIGL